MRSKRLGAALAAFVVLALALGACIYTPPQTGGQVGVEAITGELSGDIRITGDLNVDGAVNAGHVSEISALVITNGVLASDLTASDDLSVSDDALIVGDVTVGDNLTMVDGLFLRSAVAITATTTTITPTYDIYLLDAAGAVTLTLAPCTEAGQMLYLYGKDNQTITIADSDLLSTDGNAVTIGQYDLVGLMCDGADWVHMFKSANS